MSDVKLQIEDMEKAGVNFGHKVSKLHPKMKSFIAGVKNNVHLFDLEKTSKELERVLKFISKLSSEGKTIVLVGTKPQIKHLIKKTGEECNLPYVSERWLGGTFTNFETIRKRIDYFKDLESKKESGALAKYTKKERLNFDNKLRILEVKFGGIKNMSKLPEAVFIAGLDKDIIVAQEAKKKGIKILAIADSNINPNIVDYPIPANDDSISSVSYILDKIKETIINSKNG